MAIVRGLECTGRASATENAELPTDLVLLRQVSALFSGLAPLGHTHPATDITGLSAALLAVLDMIVEDTQSNEWIIDSDVRVAVRLKPNGGVLVGPEGLYLHSGIAAFVEHLHEAADVTDFDEATQARVEELLDDSDTVAWTIVGESFKATVRLKSAGGLQADADGLSCVFGSGTNQVARGDHTHAQLHNPVSFEASQSIEIEINGQVIALEVKLAPLGGLVVGPSGVGVDFGTGANQVARGNHTHAQLHDPVTTVNTPSLALGISAGQVLSGTAIVAASPPAGQGKIVIGVDGLAVVLGEGPDEAAPGDHGHDAATESEDGFMSAQDKQLLDALVEAEQNSQTRKELLVVTLGGWPSGTIPLGEACCVVVPYSGTITGWDLIADLPSGTLGVDVRRDDWDAFPPTEADSIVGAFKPQISGSRHNQNVSVNWPFDTGDVLLFHVDWATVVTKATLGLRITRR